MSVTLIIIILLVLGVVFVNGWTDAPNAIATVVSTRSMGVKPAIIMAAIFNFLGVAASLAMGMKVAETVQNLADFGSGPESQKYALVALAAALFAIVVWAVTAWYFGIPTSESHALIAGVSGGAIALLGFKALKPDEWVKVGVGLLLSSVIGIGFGYGVVKLVELLFKKSKRSSANRFFKGAQVFGGAAMAFLHGAQDGQKFIGVFLLALQLNGGKTDISDWILVLVCSAVMGIGTSIGGYKIIKAVGMDMVKLEKYQGFSADLSAAVCILIATATGIPLSTTHCKTTAIMGVGAAKRISNVDWNIAKEMVLAWVLTFPGCMLLGYLMSKLFILIF